MRHRILAIVAVSPRAEPMAASAATMGSGCEFDQGAAATYPWTYNPTTFDNGSFTHSDLAAGAPFGDFWVFDFGPAGIGPILANFTVLSSFSVFTGTLCAVGTSSRWKGLRLGRAMRPTRVTLPLRLLRNPARSFFEASAVFVSA